MPMAPKDAIVLGGGALLLLLGLAALAYFARDKEAARIAPIWREYATRRGYGLWLPKRGLLGIRFPQRSIETEARLDGVREGVPFTAEISLYDPGEGSHKGTLFQCAPPWLPDNSGIAISRGAPPKGSWLSPMPNPSLVRRTLNVYVDPPELVTVFTNPAADEIFDDLARLPDWTQCSGWRKDSNGKRDLMGPILSIRARGWTDDPEVLDATIGVLTRICRLPSAGVVR
jgi:hypothetical protein